MEKNRKKSCFTLSIYQAMTPFQRNWNEKSKLKKNCNSLQFKPTWLKKTDPDFFSQYYKIFMFFYVFKDLCASINALIVAL